MSNYLNDYSARNANYAQRLKANKATTLQNHSGLAWLESQYGLNGVASRNNGIASNAYNDQLKRANQTSQQYLNNSFINLANSDLAKQGNNAYAQSLAQSKTTNNTNLKDSDLRSNSVLAPIFAQQNENALNQGVVFGEHLNYDPNATWISNIATTSMNNLNARANARLANEKAEANRKYALDYLKAQQDAYENEQTQMNAYEKALLQAQLKEQEIQNKNLYNIANLQQQGEANRLRAEQNEATKRQQAEYKNQELQLKRTKDADEILSGIDGFTNLSDSDQARLKAEFIENGTLPKLNKTSSGFLGFGKEYEIANEQTAQQAEQDDEVAELQSYAQQNGLSVEMNGNSFILRDKNGNIVQSGRIE